MVTIAPKEENPWERAFSSLGHGLTQRYMQSADESAVRNAISKLGPNASARDILNTLTNVKTYRNDAKQQALKNYLGVENFEEMKRKAQAQEEIQTEKNRIAHLGKQNTEEDEALIENFVEQGYTRNEARALVNPAVPNSVKQGISKRVEDQLARQQRNAENVGQEGPGGTQAGAATDTGQVAGVQGAQEVPLQEEEAIAPVEEAIVKAVESSPPPKPKEQWPKLPVPSNTTAAEQEKWRDKNQTFNNKLLKEIKTKSAARTNAMIRYERSKALNNSKKLPSGLGNIVINPQTGEPYAVASLLGLVNKQTQDFVKTINDFLVDAKNYFGARVTNFDVQAFKSRLPTLLNTEDGRRLIIEQMKLMEELQIVHDTALENALKHYGRNASYSDIQSIVDERTEGKEAKIIEKINNLDQASDYMDLMANDPKFKDTILMQSQDGKFKAVPVSKVKEAESKGYVKW